MVGLMMIVFMAHLVETVMGFGATLLTLSLGAHFVQLSTLMIVLVVLGLIQSTWVVISEWRQIDFTYFKRLLALCMAGTVVGIMIRDLAGFSLIRNFVGLAVVLLATVQYLRIRSGTDKPLHPMAESGILLCGGVCHGLLACGGPLVIYCAQRSLPKDGQLRSTLGVLWLSLNVPLLYNLLAHPATRPDIGPILVDLLPAALVGIAAGTLIRARLQNAQRKLGHLVLGLCGALLGTN